MARFLRTLASLTPVLSVLTIAWAGTAHAMWPTTLWTIQELDPNAKGIEHQHLQPQKTTGKLKGVRAHYANKHQAILENASSWFQSMAFKAPHQFNDKGSLTFSGGEKYLAYLNSDTSNPVSSHSSTGAMYLSTHRGFLRPRTANDRVYEAAAVHELFHGIQSAYPAYRAYAHQTHLPGPPRCDVGERANDWLTEGTASAVQIQYLERVHGQHFAHPFHGPSDIRWVRTFDQPLNWPHLPPEHSVSLPAGAAEHSWQCSYGTWYFWYAVGNMLGSMNLNDERRVSYLQYIFEQEGPWLGTGLEMVDAGLKQAAKELDALRPYRDGLYSLYPQFVAQYLDVDDFFEKIERVTMDVPSVYETEIDIDNALEPLSTMAWRIRIQVPPVSSAIPTTVRFVLDSSDPEIKDALHLIVDDNIVTRPEDPSVPYSQLRRVHPHLLDENGGFEYFVRVANVARKAVLTNVATFTLKVELEGFYGENPATQDIPLSSQQGATPSAEGRTRPSDHPLPRTADGRPATPVDDSPSTSIDVPFAVPPGFLITGPDAGWSCEGGDNARATYAIMTPDGLADQLERMLPQSLKNIENDLDRAEIQAHGRGESELEETQQQRQRFEADFADMIGSSGIQGNVAQAAREIRQQKETQIMVKLNGRNDLGNCDVLLILTLPGAPAAQRVNSDNFSLTITSAAMANAMATARSFAEQLDFSSLETLDVAQMERLAKQFENAMDGSGLPERPWSRCDSGNTDCDEGGFELGEASEQRLFGSFSFQVFRGDLQLVKGTTIDEPREYADVTGFINITSTKDEGDNNLLDFFSRQSGDGDLLLIPGLEGFLQGGSMLED